MKHFFQHIIKTPMVFVFLFVVCFYGLAALGKPAEVNRYAIVSAIGIDKAEETDENKFEISLLTFIPIAEQTFTETYKVISSKGRSVSEALDLCGLNLAREVGLSHVKLVVLSQELINEDVTTFLDYLSRSKHMSSNTKLIVSDSSAKEFLNAAQSLDSESSIKVTELILYNSQYIYATDSSFELFYKGLFGPTRVGLIPLLKLEPEGGDGITVSATGGEQSSGRNSSGGDPNPKKQIVNNGDTIIFKGGKEIARISGQDLKKINLIKGDFKTGSIEIYNYSDKDFDDANLIFEIFDKNLKFKVVYENGIPVFNIDMTLTLSLSEVENKTGMIQRNTEFFMIDQNVADAIEKKVRKTMSEGLEIMKDNQADLFDFYTIMHNADRTKFKKFLENLEDKDEYLSHIVFKISINSSFK